MATYEHLDQDDLYALFKKHDIEFTTVHHPAVFTVEAMMPHLSDVEGVIAKNLFLKDKKKRLWLFSARHDAVVNLGDLSKKVKAPGGLRFADESVLEEKLGVKQGCVTAFALVNDKNQDVKFIVDKELLSDKHKHVFFHPLTNEASTGISPKDFEKFLTVTEHIPIIVTL